MELILYELNLGIHIYLNQDLSKKINKNDF